MEDMELLREFATNDSEKAFEALVQRHVNLVYSAAYRQVQNPTLSREVTQTVFIILARKAPQLRRGTVLSGWLYRTAQFAASKALRAELRRRHNESEAAQMIPESPDSTWQQVAPLLEEAMTGLGDKDRNAVVLRYFENKNLKDVGLALGTNERAAQKRVVRAVEKLRAFLTRRGVVVTTAMLVGALSTNAVQAAPAGMAAAAMAAGISKGVAVGTSTSALMKGTMKLMAWIKLKTAVAVGAALLVAGGTTVVVLKEASASDPIFEEKPLSYWVQAMDPLPYPEPATPNKANEALRHFGVKAVPTLVHMFQSKYTYPYLVHAFYVLGPLSKPAIPALTKLLDREDRAADVIEILGKYDATGHVMLDPEATSALVKAMTNRNSSVRSRAANSLGLLKRSPEPEHVVPALIHALKNDPDIGVRSSAAGSLCGTYKKMSPTIVPALIEALSDEEPRVRGDVLWRLGHFSSPESPTALPKMLMLLNDPVLEVRMEATNAIRVMDPKAAAMAGLSAWAIKKTDPNVPDGSPEAWNNAGYHHRVGDNE